MMVSPRVVWITGASSGIGRAVAEEFAYRGDIVIATARSLSKLQSLKGDVRSSSGQSALYKCDITDENQVDSTGKAILSRYGRLDILINNAGVTYFKDFSNTSTKEFDEVINTNLRGLFLTTKAALPSMLERGAGTILNVLSYAVKAIYTGSSAYAASKAGAEALMNVLRAETRDKGIKIVNVFLGAVFTPIWHQKHRERHGHQMMKAAEIAKVIYEISLQPHSMMMEDIVIRPQIGDLKV